MKKENAFIHGDSIRNSKHNYLYNIWCRIKQRCYDKNYLRYKDWGGRGIIVHPDWIYDYVAFKKYILTNLGERPEGKTKKGLTEYSLNRIDNDCHYEPNNLAWDNKKEQSINRRKPKLSDEDVLEIRWLLSLNKYKQKDIAVDYKVGASMICLIKNNKTRIDYERR